MGLNEIDEGQLPNGSYYVVISAPLYGYDSFASAVFPEIIPEKPIPFPVPKETIKLDSKKAYTGVVIDASGLGLQPTMSPVIYDTKGRAVYGAKNIDVNYAIEHGMVGYSSSEEDCISRVGVNHITIKAVSVRGGNNSTNSVNVVISEEDANQLLAYNEKYHFLQKCSVAFIQ